MNAKISGMFQISSPAERRCRNISRVHNLHFYINNLLSLEGIQKFELELTMWKLKMRKDSVSE